MQRQLRAHDFDARALFAGSAGIARFEWLEFALRVGAGARGEQGLHAQQARVGFTTLRSEEHTSELQSLMRISYAVFCLKKKRKNTDKKRQRTTAQVRNK